MPEPAAVRRAIDAVWRIESPRIIAGLLRSTRDIDLAEELAHDALLAALQQWPESGLPDNPGAWLMSVARNLSIDRLRRDRRSRSIADELARTTAPTASSPHDSSDARLDGRIEDDLLRLIFTACHPSLSPESRAALTLRLLCGLSTDEIARAFLLPEPTIAQRIVRAKRTIADDGIALEPPASRQLAERLPSVLEVLYLLFNEGYSATAGDDWIRPALCEEAQRLARILVGLLPFEAEAHGLSALLELQASRFRARTDDTGRPILLLDQDRARWDQLLIRRGLAALGHALELDDEPGPYTLQASIAACHARAVTAPQTDWPRIAALYADLFRLNPSPIIELNRAVAIAMAHGPQAGLDITDRITADPRLTGYHLLPSVRADLLLKLNRLPEARAEFLRAAALTRNTRERDLLLARAAAITP